jgi:hypothetical protein
MAPTSTRQSTAARKRAAAKPVVDGDLEFEPIRIAANDEIEEERVPLFFIGDDEYTIPKKIAPGVALQYLREARTHGLALEQSKALTEDQMEWIVDKVLELALGQREKQGGKAR